MKTLGNLKPNKGANQKKKRVGRGIGSGLGKTAGRGHKGMKARKSGGTAPGFEGGQTPLYRRLPKRGFTSLDHSVYSIVNLDQLEKLSGSLTIDKNVLFKAGLISSLKQPLKLLGRGKVTKALNITVNKASDSAKAAVEKVGGKVVEEK